MLQSNKCHAEDIKVVFRVYQLVCIYIYIYVQTWRKEFRQGEGYFEKGPF